MNTEAYEKILRDRQHELNIRLQRIEEDFEKTSTPDEDDRTAERSDDEVMDEMGQVGQEELKAIDAALDRVANGTFGICVNCGQPISPERLAVVPYTPFCQECAAELQART
jgi:RNA polymerase-binding transcription factor DksA